MRALLAICALLLLLSFAPAAEASKCTPACVTYGVHPTATPSTSCPECVGVSGSAGVSPGPGCADCTSYGVGVSANHDASGTQASAHVCRGGFIYICPVDKDISI